MRYEVARWMYDVCEEKNCEPTVFPTAVVILDRYLTVAYRSVEKSFLQLIGATCMLISSKLKETTPLLKSILAAYSADSFSTAQIAEMECIVLNTLKWDVDSINALDFMDLYLFKLHFLLPKRQAIINLIHHCYISPIFLRTASSILAAACVFSISKNSNSSKSSPTISLLQSTRTKLHELNRTCDSLSLLSKLSNSEAPQILQCLDDINQHVIQSPKSFDTADIDSGLESQTSSNNPTPVLELLEQEK